MTKMINKMHQMAMTSQNTVVKTYCCSKCKDTGWIEGENGFIKCICVKLQREKILWTNSGINPNNSKLKLNDYKPYDEVTTKARESAVKYIKTFDDIKGEKENSMGLFGQAGSGKTHLIIATGINLLTRKENPIPVVYMPYVESMRELKANAMDDEYYIKLFNRFTRAQLLIIDDLFKDKVKKGKVVSEITEADMKHIYPIINYRYLNYLPTIVSSECTPEMLINLDEALAGRILERCGDNITVFYSDRYNYRLRKFMKN